MWKRPWIPRRRVSALLLLMAAVPLVAARASQHRFGLAGSAPSDGAAMHHVAEVRLRFTEEPQEGSVSIRVIDAEGKVVAGSAPAPAPDDRRVFTAVLEGGLEAGAYTVVWRAMARDSHVVRGRFGFTVVAH